MNFRPPNAELYCRETMTPVEQNKMRPGYDCRCSGCTEYVSRKSLADALARCVK